ncbi:MAG TPA: NAD-dependent epimerase/dehydratase family protein [Bdellovibrionota bacterium]|nr:NAD-dependent epimerase/dehydratase family protein [Bdellovibrionota bacterium]
MPDMAQVLVMGGTQFIGRHVVPRLLAVGHAVTLLNRGVTGPDAHPGVARIRADRASEELAHTPGLVRDWDAVVDLCAYWPADVARLLGILRGRVGHYVQCSSISAYRAMESGAPIPLMTESDPLLDCSHEEAKSRDWATYGKRKAECERVARRESSAPVTILRPGLVYGRYDHTDRFGYWVHRARGDAKFLLPEGGIRSMRRTYAPDLGAAFAAAIDRPVARGGSYNVGETEPPTLRRTLELLGDHFGRDVLPRAVSVSADRLRALGVQPWSDLPLWLAGTDLAMDTAAARKDLASPETPHAQAISDAAQAFVAEGRAPRAGLTDAREAEILAKIC